MRASHRLSSRASAGPVPAGTLVPRSPRTRRRCRRSHRISPRRFADNHGPCHLPHPLGPYHPPWPCRRRRWCAGSMPTCLTHLCGVQYLPLHTRSHPEPRRMKALATNFNDHPEAASRCAHHPPKKNEETHLPNHLHTVSVANPEHTVDNSAITMVSCS